MTPLISIQFPLTPGLNGPDGLIRQHWAKAAKKKKEYKLLALSQRPRGWVKISHPIKVVFTRFEARVLDRDNALASIKHLLDSLEKAGIIENDGPKIVAEIVVKQVKVNKKETKSTIEIYSTQ